MTADAIIRALELKPHPEGGHYRETWRQHADAEGASGSAIYYLLRAGERSQWHRFAGAELWHFYAGSPLELLISPQGAAVQRRVLGPDVLSGARPQVLVAADQWQSATTLGAWTLVGCTTAPAFEFEHFELAPEDWQPGT
jgi:predicted cupin superfamily sugar epimerase